MFRFALALLFSIGALASPPVALIYKGPGSCPEKCSEASAEMAKLAGFQARFITPAEINAAAFKGASVYIQPGGVSGIIADTLTSAQKENIRDFVANGGGYVDFCAGANFAAANIRDAKTGGYLKQVDLGLIPMTAHLYVEQQDAVIYSMTWDGQPRQLYWEGGPYFETPLAPGLDVFATYPNGPIASVRAAVGRGRVS